MGRLDKHVEKNTENYWISSKKKLKSSIEHKMKRIYVEILNALEKEEILGNIDTGTFNALRSRILNIGNDQIRCIKKELDDRYNVEFLAYQMIFPVKPLEGSPSVILDGRI